MVAPMVLTGVFNAIAKTKKASWKAMKGAMGAVKQAAGPMASIANALKVFAPIMKVVNALFKFLGATILLTVMPALKPLLDMLSSPLMLSIMEDIGEIIGIALIPVFKILTTVLKVIAPILKKVTEFFLDNEWALNLLILAMSPLLGLLLLLTNNWEDIAGVLRTVGNAFIWFINAISDAINMLMNAITFGNWANIPNIPYLHSGTDYVPRTGGYYLEQGEQVIAKGNKSKPEIHVHIDLRNAVVDNVDRLSQKIAEQVLIQIG
jgi:phage-related protein